MQPQQIATMRRLMKICESITDEESDRWDDDATKRLADLLSIWGQGWAGRAWNSPKLHSDLLALRGVAREWRDANGAPDLYRAFMPTPQQLSSLAADGRFVIETPVDRPLASWSSEENGALEWITGFDSPWVVFCKPTRDLDIFINFGEACNDLFGDYPQFAEIIVVMPHRMIITSGDIVRRKG